MSSRDQDTSHRDPAPDSLEEAEGMDAASWIGHVIDGRYRIVDYLDEGAMGFVFAGEHIGLRRPVAIKILRASLSAHASFPATFQREARAEASANSPHIVEVYDVGPLERGGAYVVMELLEGRTLEALLEEGPLPWPRACELARQMCHGLAAAHRAGVVHRDIKPANLFLARDDLAPSGETLKILDFGLAEHRDERPFSSLGLGAVGTPAYMSPEQCLAERADARSDIYSAGIVLYEMLSGSLPFHGDVRALMRDQLHRAPPPLRLLPSDPPCPDALASIVEKALSKSPDDRHRTAEELEAALRAAGASPEPSDPPGVPSLPQSTMPPTGTRWRAMLAASLPVVLGATLVMGGVWPATRAEPASASTAATGEKAARAIDAPPPATRPAVPAQEQPVVAPRPEHVVVRSEPLSAAVVHGSVYIGQTPLRVTRPRDGSSVVLSIRRNGYASRHIRIGERGPPSVTVRLDRQQRSAGGVAESVIDPEPASSASAVAPEAGSASAASNEEGSRDRAIPPNPFDGSDAPDPIAGRATPVAASAPPDPLGS